MYYCIQLLTIFHDSTSLQSKVVYIEKVNFLMTLAPPSIASISDNQTVPEGSRVVILCNVTGSEPMVITWKKVGYSSSIGNGSSLILENVKTADNGGYWCSATNGRECATAKSTPSYLYVVCKYRPHLRAPCNSGIVRV